MITKRENKVGDMPGVGNKSETAELLPKVTEENPWQVKGTRKVYDNPWISVREDDVVQPDGNPGIYGVVHFKNKAIGILPIDDSGFVYLVGQYRFPLQRYSWEIPEGGCPEGEDPLAAAKRELLEETGLSAKQWRLLGKADLSNSATDEEALLYLATDLTHGDAAPEPTEELSYCRVTFAETLHMVNTGKITDAMSVLAILFYAIQTGDKGLSQHS
jgi:8-oxo-dGTP pyrophosphatase MutT (NUDIX family)